MKHTFYVSARFMGTNGSMGYIRGRIYLLMVVPNFFGNTITIAPLNGVSFRPIEDMQCPYSNMEAFLANWEIIKIERVNYWNPES